MRSLRAAPLTVRARWVTWWADRDPHDMVSRWRGRWRLFWAGVAPVGQEDQPMLLGPGLTCPYCRLAELVRHCKSRGCGWLRCPHCFKRMRHDSFRERKAD